MTCYLDGLSSPAEFAALQDRLRDSPSHRRLFVQVCSQAQALAEGLGAQELVGAEIAEEPTDDELSDVFLEVIEQALHARAIHDIEDAANKQLAEDAKQQRLEALRDRMFPEAKPTGPRVIVIPKAVVYLGTGLIAALVMLTIYLIAAPDPKPPANSAPADVAETIGTPPAPTPLVPGTPTYVAELASISDDAVWADQSMGWVAGMQLEAGELHLAKGSIVVRLLDGAEVTLHAPARFTLLSTNNSELHHGHLSAQVPESAHGFEVLFPGGVITDLGTAFRLYVNDSPKPHPSHVEVTQGLITVAPRQSGQRGQAVPLKPNQFATVSTDGSELSAYEYTNVPTCLDAPSTGVHRRHAQADPAWTIRAAGDDRAYAAVVIAPDDWNGSEYRQLHWLPGDTDSSHWIGLDRSGSTANALDSPDGSGTLVFSTRLEIPDNYDPESIELRLRMILDNRLTAIRVNGREVAGPFDVPFPRLGEDAVEQYQVWINHTLRDCFRSGENTLEFEVHNSSGPCGVRIEMLCLGTQVYAPLESR